MLTLLSPAKKLLNFKNPASVSVTLPVFQHKTDELLSILKQFSLSNIGALMHLSDSLAKLNYERYQHFVSGQSPENLSYPAVLLFQGDVYQSLKAAEWDEKTSDFARNHLAILSGLYGLLSPYDLIQPYRLEMGTALTNPCGKNLYDFWRLILASEIQKRLKKHDCPVLINLASEEYFKAVDIKQLQVPVISVHFMEKKGNTFKVIGIHAKKARGAMAGFIMQNQLDSPEALKSFTGLDYHYCEKSGDQYNFNFIRS